MKIGINGFEAVVPRFGYADTGLPNRVGSSEVCYQLLVELEKIDNKNEYTVYLPQKPTSDMPDERAGWKYEVIPSTKLWTIFGLNRKLIRSKLDLFFSPTHYAPLFLSCPSIISILDVSYEYYPELFNKKDKLQLATWGKFSLAQASKVITISNSSKDDIIKVYKVPPQKVAVVHLGIKGLKSDTDVNSKELMEKYDIKNPYILFVGTLQPRKNIVRLIEAFAALSDKNLNLVIIGRRGWKYEEILAAPQKFGVENRVYFLENVTDSELPEFYKNTQVFVLPSLYEGFGLPILEAMKYGAPVATSSVSSLPEAGGEAAEYFDPLDVADIAKAIEKVLGSEKHRSDMIKKGHEQVKKFSWEKAAREVLDVFEEVAK